MIEIIGMPELNMCVDGFNKDGERTYTGTINYKTYKGLTMNEVMNLLKTAEEEGEV